MFRFPDSKVHVDHMGPTWVLPAPAGPHVVPMNLAIRVIQSYDMTTTKQITANCTHILWDISYLSQENPTSTECLDMFMVGDSVADILSCTVTVPKGCLTSRTLLTNVFWTKKCFEMIFCTYIYNLKDSLGLKVYIRVSLTIWHLSKWPIQFSTLESMTHSIEFLPLTQTRLKVNHNEDLQIWSIGSDITET